MAMLSNLLLRARLPRNDYLLIGLLVSLSVHGAALAIKLHAQQPAAMQPRPLEVALVNTETELAPLDPQVLAQANLLAGGNDETGLATTPLPRTADRTDDVAVLAELRKRQQQLEQEQQRLLERLESRQRALQA